MKIGKKVFTFGAIGILLVFGSLFFMNQSSIKASETPTSNIRLEQTEKQIQESLDNEVYFSLNVKSTKKDQLILLEYSDEVTFDKEKILEMNKEKISLVQIDDEKNQLELTLNKESKQAVLYFQAMTSPNVKQVIQASSEQERSNELIIGKEDIKSVEASSVRPDENLQARASLATPYAEEWTEIFTAEEASIIAGEGKELRYGFGPTDAIGKTSISGNKQKQFAIPNVTFMDNDKRVQHIYHTQNPMSKPEDAGQSLWTSYGLIYAFGSNTSPSIFNTGSHITSEGYKYYKRILPNGMTVYKLVYNTEFSTKKLRVEILMTGKTTGTVNVEYTVTNIGAEREANFIVGSMIDTELNKNDKVPIYAIGDNKGVYIQDAGENGYKLQYLFSGGPDYVQNWTGKHWIQGTNTQPRDYFLSQFFNYDDSGFTALDSHGYEAENYPADQLVYVTSDIRKMDTAIFMKNQPTSLGIDESTKMTYDVTIGLPGNPPEVFIDQADQELIQGNDFEVTGQWRDSESPLVDLYYTLNDGTAVKFGDKVPNDMTNPGKKINWSFTLPKSALSLGKQVIKVYAVDSEGHTSEEKVLNLTIKAGEADLTVHFIDEENNVIHPKIVLTRKVGSKVDLTKEADVLKAVNDQLEKKYEILSSPVPENAIEIVEGGREVTYQFKGRIVLVSAPTEIDFGTQIVKAEESVIEEPVRIDGALVIQDSRATKKPWKLQARMKQELTNSNQEIVTNAVRYIYSGNEVTLNAGMQDVAVGTNKDGAPNKVSDKWSASGDGFKLKTEVGAVKESGIYVGIIEWELLEGP